ncbi:MAG: tetratricopeptide repeat protein [Candidatus Paceibacterota bacterium]|jgi:Flp pilus assembly protein TadD
MDKTEKETFNIKETIHQTPFDSVSAQAFLRKWAEINDGMKIQFLDREKWEEKKEKGSFYEKIGEEAVLSLPDNLHLWEMVGIMEEIDRDTFTEKPEKAKEKKEEMEALGKMIANTAKYISERIHGIGEGKEIAHAMADEFFAYEKLLAHGKKESQETELSEEENKEIDRWLLGENIADSRLQTIENKEEREKRRMETLAQFFRVTEKAFILENTDLKQLRKQEPWKDTTPIHSAFLRKVKQSIRGEAEKPKWEFGGAIFRRGTEGLLKNLERPLSRELVSSFEYYAEKLFGKEIASSIFGEQKKLVEALRLPDLKKDLEEIRKKGDLAEIAEKEREIAAKIQQATSSFSFHQGMNNPEDIITKKYINCVGASILGGSLFSEVGLTYLVGSVPEHSFLFLLTSDDKIIWFDMLYPEMNEELTDDALAKPAKNENRRRVSDIIAFSKKPSQDGITFDIDRDMFQEKMPFDVERKENYITLFSPKEGGQLQLLGNTSGFFIKNERYEEAIETCKQAMILSPKHPNIYNNLGYALLKLNRNEEAIAEYKKVIAFDPEYSLAYDGIGEALFNLGDISGARKTFEKEISLYPNDLRAHIGLGRVLQLSENDGTEAENEFRKAISLNDRLAEAYFYLAQQLEKEGRIAEADSAYRNFLSRADETQEKWKIKIAAEATKTLTN